MSAKAIVLDANILIRAVLGTRVWNLICQHPHDTRFFAPDAAFADAYKYLPSLLEKRGANSAIASLVLDHLPALINPLSTDIYSAFELPAMLRIRKRDPDDWPIVACAMALACPIWTEDRDFFGIGIPIWSSDLVDQFFASS